MCVFERKLYLVEARGRVVIDLLVLTGSRRGDDTFDISIVDVTCCELLHRFLARAAEDVRTSNLHRDTSISRTTRVRFDLNNFVFDCERKERAQCSLSTTKRPLSHKHHQSPNAAECRTMDRRVTEPDYSPGLPSADSAAYNESSPVHLRCAHISKQQLFS